MGGWTLLWRQRVADTGETPREPWWCSQELVATVASPGGDEP